MKIAAYCRVSTEKEAQIDSLEKQIEFFNEFTKSFHTVWAILCYNDIKPKGEYYPMKEQS